MDWALPTDELLAVAELVTPERSVAPSSPGERAVEPDLVSQLRKIAAYLKQAF